jgi:hypothetical protein
MERGVLLEHSNKMCEVGGFVLRFNENVQMVRHEAVGEHRKARGGCGARQLRHDETHGLVIGEASRAFERQNREEISIETGVIESAQSWRRFSRHGAMQATYVPIAISGPT